MKHIPTMGALALLLATVSATQAWARQDKQDAKPATEQKSAPAPKQAPAQKQAPAPAPARQAAAPQARTAPAPAPAQKQAETPARTTAARPAPAATAAARPTEARSTPTAAGKPASATTPKAQPARESAAPRATPPQRSAVEVSQQRAQPALRLSVRGSARIPDQRFAANFGAQHQFRIGAPTIVGGYSRFQYGGFWFGFVQPWPVGWYYSDEVYVVYVDNGYYLLNPYYPGARVSISVAL